MSIKQVSSLIASLSVVIILLVVYWCLDTLNSPGSLSPAHARISELRGSKGCRACHGVEKSVMHEACVDCHEIISEQLANDAGLHGGLDKSIIQRCDRCHFEHIGDAIALVSDQAFTLAGVADVKAYAHEHTDGFGLTGRHDELGCRECHVHADANPIGEGERRFLGYSQDCIACHESPHEDDLDVGCADCHGQSEPFALVAEFEHPDTFLLVDGHASISCIDCHGGTTFESISTDCASCHIENYNGSTDPDHTLLGMSQDCAACHTITGWTETEYEHTGEFPILGAHMDASCIDCHNDLLPLDLTPTGPITDCATCHLNDFNSTTSPNHSLCGLGQDCASCHTNTDWVVTDYEHTESFSLLGAHAKPACVDCHNEESMDVMALSESSQSLEVRGCGVCHDSPHSNALTASFASASETGNPDGACALCHDSQHESFLQPEARMTADLHALTGFSLDPPHDTQECAQCHADIDTAYTEASWMAAYPGRAQEDCQSCHDDPHLGQFLEGESQGRCFNCHLPQTFRPSRFDLTMHAQGAFPLEGLHRAVACVACHLTDGETRTYAGTASACSDCHDDPHDGRFDDLTTRQGDPATVGCARCHTTESFHDVVWTADEHARLAKYPLLDAHAEASCRDCHARSASPATAATIFEPASPDCAGCHIDKHQGQFRREDATDCARCHASFRSFNDSAFDHQTQGRFKLDDDHKTLECVACHRVYESDFGPVIRYKPLGIRCQDCHDSRSVTGEKTS